jgi:hypothetical protein
MRVRILLFTTFAFATAFIGVRSVSAQHSFNQTGAGTFDSNANGNWNNGVPTGDGQDVDFQQSISGGNQTVTNFFSSNGGSLNYLRLATGGSSLLTVISTAGFISQYGLQLNANDTLILASSSYNLSQGNNSFDDGNGTLILSNGATAFVNLGNNAVQNRGTITLDAGSSQTSDLNYGQSTGAGFNNSGTGTIIKNDSGTGSFTGNFGGNNISLVNNGTMIVNGGTLVVNPVDAFSDNGFHNNTSGQIVVNSGATFAVNRDANAWNNGGIPQNDGTITLNGGSLTALESGSQAANHLIQNNNLIIGSGTLAMSVAQASGGNTIASNGVLNIFGSYAGNQATFTSVSGQFGTFKAVSGGTLKFNGTVTTGMGGSWNVSSGGTLDVNSQSVDLGQAFMPGSNMKGTISVTTGGNFTLSSTVSGGGYQDNQGTFSLGGGSILMPNDSAHAVTGEFTNSATGTIVGNGTLQTGFGGGGAPDYAIVNHGSIVATNGTLVLNPNDANNLGGVQNAVDGTIVLANNGTLAIARTANAWNNSGGVTNFGTVQMNGGSINAVSLGGGASTKFVNASGGMVKGSGTVDSSWTSWDNNGTIQATGPSPLVISAATLNNNSSGVITANTSRIIINGALNNASGGTVSMLSGVGTFNGAVVNSGAWITDPSTNVFNNTYTVTSSGYISAAAGDVYDFHSNFVNQSTQNTSYKTFNTTAGGSGASGTKFIFDNASALGTTLTQQFVTAGLKLTGGFTGTPSPLAEGIQYVSSFAVVTGFQNNDALDRLEIGNLGTNSLLELSSASGLGGSGNTNALFVDDLWLLGSSDLIISNNTVLYFVNSNNWSSANVTLLGNGEIHQLEVEPVSTVPEPTVMLLWVCGGATVYAARRRGRKLGRNK